MPGTENMIQKHFKALISATYIFSFQKFNQQHILYFVSVVDIMIFASLIFRFTYVIALILKITITRMRQCIKTLHAAENIYNNFVYDKC